MLSNYVSGYVSGGCVGGLTGYTMCSIFQKTFSRKAGNSPNGQDGIAFGWRLLSGIATAGIGSGLAVTAVALTRDNSFGSSTLLGAVVSLVNLAVTGILLFR